MTLSKSGSYEIDLMIKTILVPTGVAKNVVVCLGKGLSGRTRVLSLKEGNNEGNTWCCSMKAQK
ncbi:MAG: hypothetical protein ACD_62C00001G0008 [uncultured bacterium]|nr:MAG: hypothetical protein ACD_62C00001G0008 [uncultured bacterium]